MHYIRNQPVEDTKGSVATRNRQPLMSWRRPPLIGLVRVASFLTARSCACTSYLNQGFTRTPPRGTPQRPLVPKLVRSLHASLSPPLLGILHATPDARPPPLATAPQARPQISDQAPQKRNAQTEVRILDPILYTAYPPCSPDNALTYQEPMTV